MDRRISNIQNSMKKKDLDFLLVTSQPNITYFTGLRNMSGLLIIPRKDVPTLLVSVTERSRAEICEPKIRVFAATRHPNAKADIKASSMFEAVQKVIGKKKWDIGFEEKNPSVSSYDNMKKYLRGKFKPCSDIISELRAIKSSEEIKKLQRAAEIVDEGVLAARELLRIGMSERELASQVEEQMRRDSDWFSFETIVASGPYAADVHHPTCDRKIEKNDLVVVDAGAIFEGYCSDITRTFCLSAEKRQIRMYDAVIKAQKSAINAVKAGASAKKIYFVAAKVLKKSGFSLIHSVGHGLGLEVHESPSLSPDSKEKLKVGMVFTVEPGVYVRGLGGVRIEDMILLTEKGHQMMTKAARWL